MLIVILIIAAVLAVALIAVFGIAAMKPDHFRVERSIEIDASPETIFPFINDLKKQISWSPWEKKDPDMQRTYSGAEAGPGAKYHWSGDKNIGEGRMEIVESSPQKGVLMKLDFISPMQANNLAEFRFDPRGGKTSVTWAIFGPHPLLHRAMGLFMSFDKMVGNEFEKGLASLKAQVETR